MSGRKKTSGRTINLAVTDKILEKLDSIAANLGMASRSEAMRYIILRQHEQMTTPGTGVGIATQGGRFSLGGITDGNELTDQDFEELKGIWETER